MRKPRRAITARSSGSAIGALAARAELLRPARSRASSRKVRTCRSGSAPSSAMFLSPSFTASASGRRRRPLHASQVRVTDEAAELVVANGALVVDRVVVVVVVGGARRRRASTPRRRSSRGTIAVVAPRLRFFAARRGRPVRRGSPARAPRGASLHGDVGVRRRAPATARVDLGRERDGAAAAPRERPRLRAACARIGDDALGIDRGARADAVARRAGAVRAVEREHPRLDGRQRDAAVDAGEALAHPERLARLSTGSTSSRPSPILSASSTESVTRPFSPP